QPFVSAAVLDNQSQDVIFDAGRNRRRGAVTKSMLTAAASLHGLLPTFFHSDAVVFNPDPSQPAHVTAWYRCLSGSCGSGTASFDLAPGQARLFNDVVVALFGANECGRRV